eukprot:TRINITY_DN3097_c0_g1_i2.p1 TRINITY_DN3097_c0_g1~~TRINITY_DN3097_c0_g1_i2.p1  ORF type:complete len:222 (-),score=-12.99 TRINITY_DN3097_c0_g1_i2:191-856(-)
MKMLLVMKNCAITFLCITCFVFKLFLRKLLVYAINQQKQMMYLYTLLFTFCFCTAMLHVEHSPISHNEVEKSSNIYHAVNLFSCPQEKIMDPFNQVGVKVYHTPPITDHILQTPLPLRPWLLINLLQLSKLISSFLLYGSPLQFITLHLNQQFPLLGCILLIDPPLTSSQSDHHQIKVPINYWVVLILVVKAQKIQYKIAFHCTQHTSIITKLSIVSRHVP